MKLNNYRTEIDRIDSQIIDLLKRRLLISEKIGLEKFSKNLKIKDAGREKEILDKVKLKAKKANINMKHIETIYKRILKFSRTIQGERLKSGQDTSEVS